eukprot:3061158-Heterocapsa_arctica.AAC.1
MSSPNRQCTSMYFAFAPRSSPPQPYPYFTSPCQGRSKAVPALDHVEVIRVQLHGVDTGQHGLVAHSSSQSTRPSARH